MSGFEPETDPSQVPHWDQYDQSIQPSNSATSDMMATRGTAGHAISRYNLLTLLEDSLRRQESRASPVMATLGTAGHANGSGLSEEKISQRLHLETAKGKMSEELCSICLCEFKEKHQIGRLECRHGYHVDCIKRWLLSKNVCPVCRSTAFTVS